MYRPSERPWQDGVTLGEYMSVARETIGLDRSGEEEEDWCNQLWGKPSSPGVKSAMKRKQREDEWFRKLQSADGRSSTRRRVSDVMSWNDDTENLNVPVAIQPKNFARPPAQAMSPVTNLNSEVNLSATPSTSVPIPSLKSSGALANLDPSFHAITAPKSVSQPQKAAASLSSELSAMCACEMHTVPAALSSFLEDAIVWFARPAGVKRPVGRTPSSQIVPLGQQVNLLDPFLLMCGWMKTAPPFSSSWTQKGVIFVDDKSQQWLTYPMEDLLQRRSELVCETSCQSMSKPVWVLSMRILEPRTWTTAGVAFDIDNYCLSRLG